MLRPATLAFAAASLGAGTAALTFSGAAGGLDVLDELGGDAVEIGGFDHAGSLPDAELFSPVNLLSLGPSPRMSAQRAEKAARMDLALRPPARKPCRRNSFWRSVDENSTCNHGDEYRTVQARMFELTKDNGTDMPNMSQVEDLLQSVLHHGAKDPCEADILATIGPAREDHIGFGSRMNNFVNELMVAVAGNYSFAVCGDTLEDGFAKHVWKSHFNSSKYIPMCTKNLSRCDFDDYWNEKQPFWMGYKLSRSLRSAPDYLTELKMRLTAFIYQLDEHTKGTVDILLNQTLKRKRNPGLQYVGVHIRHGDKAIEAKQQPVGVYVRAVQKELDACRSRDGCDINTVFLSSDDPKAAPALRTLLGGNITVVEQSRLDDQGAYSHQSSYEGKEALLKLLADIEGLRQADVFIGTASSNIGRLVYFQRPKDHKSVSLDVQFLTMPG